MGISDFSDMLADTVRLKKKSGTDGYGKPSYGTPDTYKARVVYKQRLVRTALGEEVVATGNVLIEGTPVINSDDLLELPDGSTPIILTTSRTPDEKGAHHTRVYFRVTA